MDISSESVHISDTNKESPVQGLVESGTPDGVDDQPPSSSISSPSAGLPEQGDHNADGRAVELPVVD